VGEIELIFRESLHANVVLAYFQVVKGESLEKARLQVRGNYAPVMTHSFTEPGCDGAAAGPDLKATPASFDTGPLQMSDSPRIVEH